MNILGVELETTRQNCKDNMLQAILTESERFTQMQWDMEELRSKCLEMKLKLKIEHVCYFLPLSFISRVPARCAV
jgi:hypothetical protein